MKLITATLTTVLLLFSILRCNLINPDEKIPSYIHIDSFTVSGNYDTVGSLSHKITDAWVMVDNEFVGVFELPCTVPVLQTGPHQVILRAGIYENGISLTRLPYSFYNYYTASYNLQAKKIDTINPTVKYLTNGIKYEFCEDFESSKSAFKPSDLSQVQFTRSDSAGTVFEGKYSMKAVMDTAHSFFEMQTYGLYNIPRNQAAFVELNYKSDISFQIGYVSVDLLTGDENKHLVLNLNPSSTWKKIYVNFGTEINFEKTGLVFKVFIGTVKTNDSQYSTLYLDNVKLICFE